MKAKTSKEIESKKVATKKVDNIKEEGKKVITKKVIEEKIDRGNIFKNIKVKRGLDGFGLFAMENIKKEEKIVEYIGEILLGEEAVNAKVNMYLFEVNKNKTIDGSVRWNTARYINHSCDGNAESEIRKGRVYVIAKKNIKEGEEITYDYGEEFFKEYIKDKGCRCVAKKHLYSK